MMAENGMKKGNGGVSSVLLSRDILKLEKFVARGTEQYGMWGVSIKPRFSEATDGKMLLRVPHAPDDVRCYPGIESFEGDGEIPESGIFVTPEILKQVFAAAPKKASAGILRHVLATINGGKLVLIAKTPTGATTSVVVEEAEGSTPFPPTDDVFPQGRVVHTFSVDPDRLGQFCSAARDLPTLTFQFYGKEKAIRLSFKTDEEIEVTGLLMPIL